MLINLENILMDIVNYFQTVRHLRSIIKIYTKMMEHLNEHVCTVQDVLDMFKTLYEKIPLNAQTNRDRFRQSISLSPNSKFKTLNLDINISAHTLNLIRDNGDKQIIDSEMFYNLIIPEFRFVVRKYNCTKIANHTATYKDFKKLRADL